MNWWNSPAWIYDGFQGVVKGHVSVAAFCGRGSYFYNWSYGNWFLLFGVGRFLVYSKLQELSVAICKLGCKQVRMCCSLRLICYMSRTAGSMPWPANWLPFRNLYLEWDPTWRRFQPSLVRIDPDLAVWNETAERHKTDKSKLWPEPKIIAVIWIWLPLVGLGRPAFSTSPDW